MKRILVLVLMLITMIFSSVNAAITTDAGVLGGLERNSDLYSYLNMYHYRLWKSDHRFMEHDMYISQDDAVIVSIFNDRLDAIYILKPGYKTNKGIEVGMDLNAVKNVYGPIYDWYEDDSHIGGNLIGNGQGKYRKYYGVEYVSKENSGLSFVISNDTYNVVLIRYQKNRHGNTHVFSDVESYNLLS